MKSIFKGFIIGLVFVIIGAVIIVATLGVNGWSIEEKNYNMQTYKAENDNSLIEIDASVNSLKTEFYDGDKIEVSYPESKFYKTEIHESDGKLKFGSSTKWYASFFSSAKLPETVIKLPKDKVYDIKVDLSSGTITLASGVYGNLDFDVSAGTLKADGVTCNKIDCDVSAGTVKLSAIACPDIAAHVSAGTLNIGVNGAKSDYTIRAHVSAGKCNISNQTGTTDKKISVECSAGTVNVKFSVDN